MKGEIIMTIKIEDNIPMRFKLNNKGEPKREFGTAINAVVQFTKRLSAS